MLPRIHRSAVFPLLAALGATLNGQITLRVMPPTRSSIARGQRFDIRVEATQAGPGAAPSGLRVTFDDRDLTGSNILDPGEDGERGRGGTGATGAALPSAQRAAKAPPNTTNFLLRDFVCDAPGRHEIKARTADGAAATVVLEVYDWSGLPNASRPVKNLILLLGDGMGAAHRTAARIVSRGLRDGKANAPLAMDTMEVTGQVMTASLNAAITDSAPGMAAYVTGAKANNNQEGVFPDNTIDDAFDNPRIEYLGELLRRTRGKDFHVGIVTTADVTDATPAANVVHTANRMAGPAIAERYVDEWDASGVSVLLGGGAANFRPEAAGGKQKSRDLEAELRERKFALVKNRTELSALVQAQDAPERVLGLFHDANMAVAFDKVGAGRYSSELALKKNERWRDQPMLDDMARLALRVLATHAKSGFYLMIEGASIDKRAHAADAERTIWDVIEFDNAVQIALDFARRGNEDDDPDNDTLVLVTADHEAGGMAPIGVGNELYLPEKLGHAERDYCAVFRFQKEQVLELFPNYEIGPDHYPLHPDPTRKLLLGWAAATDRYENWVSNRIQLEPAVEVRKGARMVAVVNPLRDGPEPPAGPQDAASAADVDNKTVSGVRVPGFLVAGTIENGQTPCGQAPGDTAASPLVFAGHTATDVPLSASGPGALLFTGTFDNTDVMRKLLLVASGCHASPGARLPR